MAEILDVAGMMGAEPQVVEWAQPVEVLVLCGEEEILLGAQGAGVTVAAEASPHASADELIRARSEALRG